MPLHHSFVYLDEIDPTILYDIRYSGSLNFVGEIINGYQANRPVMTEVMARALQEVQKIVNKDGFSLVIYDAYRPQKAVDHFGRWSENIHQQIMKQEFYPHIDKSKSFELGFISKQSWHSRGSTVDLTIIEKSKKLLPVSEITATPRTLKNGRKIMFLDDGTVDMGSHFDLFDEVSYHESTVIEENHLSSRTYLRDVMMENGFSDYAQEWWHYSLTEEPFPDTWFDFDITGL